MNVTLTHIDTCLPGYLQDHHNRDGELLLGVAIDGDTTYQTVKDELLSEFNAIGSDTDPDEADFLAALEEEFEGCDMLKQFDSSLETNESEHDWEEAVYAYFLLSWDTDAEDSDCRPNI